MKLINQDIIREKVLGLLGKCALCKRWECSSCRVLSNMIEGIFSEPTIPITIVPYNFPMELPEGALKRYLIGGKYEKFGCP